MKHKKNNDGINLAEEKLGHKKKNPTCPQLAIIICGKHETNEKYIKWIENEVVSKPENCDVKEYRILDINFHPSESERLRKALAKNNYWSMTKRHKLPFLINWVAKKILKIIGYEMFDMNDLPNNQHEKGKGRAKFLGNPLIYPIGFRHGNEKLNAKNFWKEKK